MRYTISIYLDRFLKTDIISHDVDGKKMKGIFIPFAPNNIYTSRNGYITYLSAREVTNSTSDATHYLLSCLTKKQRERWKQALADKKATMGYMSPTYATKMNTSANTDNIDEILNKH